jgi:2-C-methyl-D-erythritol 2,4-cyclodiphosphate synthase
MVGIGTDLHRLETGRKLVIGGINIESEIGCVAHSDGDVLLHALTDALLGAIGEGDIGELFPDNDMKYKDMDSSIFVLEALKRVKSKGLYIVNIDAVVSLQTPKLSTYKLQIKENVANICDIDSNKVNIKAKTGEKLGHIGNSLGVEALCIVQLC